MLLKKVVDWSDLEIKARKHTKFNWEVVLWCLVLLGMVGLLFLIIETL